MIDMKLSAPWVNYFHELEALFREDPDVKLTYNNDDKSITLYVNGTAKAEALEELLPEEMDFGQVTLSIIVIPSNEKRTKASLLKDAFAGNEAFSFMETIQGPMSNPMTFIVFKNKVVQYYTDNMGDIYGQRSTLYQDMAKEIFGESEGVFFCTDLPKEEE